MHMWLQCGIPPSHGSEKTLKNYVYKYVYKENTNDLFILLVFFLLQVSSIWPMHFGRLIENHLTMGICVIVASSSFIFSE